MLGLPLARNQPAKRTKQSEHEIRRITTVCSAVYTYEIQVGITVCVSLLMEVAGTARGRSRLRCEGIERTPPTLSHLSRIPLAGFEHAVDREHDFSPAPTPASCGAEAQRVPDRRLGDTDGTPGSGPPDHLPRSPQHLPAAR